jgi:hypothetical protein
LAKSIPEHCLTASLIPDDDWNAPTRSGDCRAKGSVRVGLSRFMIRLIYGASIIARFNIGIKFGWSLLNRNTTGLPLAL